MNSLPASFEERIKAQLPAESEAFFHALQTAPPVSIRLNPGKPHPVSKIFPDVIADGQVPWCDHAYYLSKRPSFTLDPLFHGGAYYVQEASSMFLQHILKQLLPSTPVRILDLCAAPGGKSTLIASQISRDSLLVSNEVIRSRATILKENIIKWGQDNIVVTNNDPADFRRLTGAFDLIVVDAPCSGEGMFRKDPEAIREWNENNLRLCQERQQRILADIWECLKPGGFLIYSTCTYNPAENEAMLEWLTREYEAQSIRIQHDFTAITSSESETWSYHFYPHKTKGEGFFTGVVQKTDGKTFTPRKNKKQQKLTDWPDTIKPYIRQAELYTPYFQENVIGVVPSAHAKFICELEQSLRIIYKGCELAELNNRKLKLLPPSALWQGLNKANCSVLETDRNTALTFLRKEEISASDLSGKWIWVAYEGIGLGWCKNLGNRLNNYFPKEWRIRLRTEE